MENLENVVSKLKCESVNYIIDEYMLSSYGIKTCHGNIFKTFENIQLELIFLSNLNYVNLNPSQLNKILVGNYTNLVSVKKKLTKTDRVDDIDQPVIINNIINENDWDQIDW